MESRTFTVLSQKNPIVKMQVTPGHFTTSSSHVNYYLDVSELKSNIVVARGAARELAVPYKYNLLADVIVCMEGTEMLAAYLAQELLNGGTLRVSETSDIHVLTPSSNINGQLVFPQNVQQKILGKRILLLVASVSTGKTVRRAMECLEYYGGDLVGVSALFSDLEDVNGTPINSLFSCEDIPGYKYYRIKECEICARGERLDAIINSDGYTKM